MSALQNDPRLPARFWAKVETGPIPADRPDLGPCWIWTGANRDGYGAFKADAGSSKVVSAHRHAYLNLVGPTDLILDHLCRVRFCVNTAHLEPVTVAENNSRSPIVLGTINAAKTHCPRNHPYDEANTRYSIHGNRNCRACQREKRAEARELRRAA